MSPPHFVYLFAHNSPSASALKSGGSNICSRQFILTGMFRSHPFDMMSYSLRIVLGDVPIDVVPQWQASTCEGTLRQEHITGASTIHIVLSSSPSGVPCFSDSVRGVLYMFGMSSESQFTRWEERHASNALSLAYRRYSIFVRQASQRVPSPTWTSCPPRSRTSAFTPRFTH